MGKKILIITASLRNGSNTDILAKEFMRGSEDAGHSIEIISLKNKEIGFCRACYYCEKEHKCIQNDSVNEILEKMLYSDVIVFASPVYFYEMSGILKTLLDRTMPIYFENCRFKEVYVISASTDDNINSADRLISGIEGWIECFPGVKLCGTICGVGAGKPGTAKKHSAFSQAYFMGREV
ncbi:MAG: flavodoxin family protein [Clostridia bacterium]|nr:flavodoxin family protein [Clostridia bacterium]